MTIDLPTVERIKTVTAQTIADELGPQGVRLAALVLDAIDRAIADPTTPEPFPVGMIVTGRETGGRGVIVRRIQQHGELHTVIVQWEGAPGEVAVSPRTLSEVD